MCFRSILPLHTVPQMQVALDFGAYAQASSQPGYLLTLSLPSEDDDKCYYDKLDIVETQKMSENESFVLQTGQQPPDDMLAYLRLMNIGGATFASCLSKLWPKDLLICIAQPCVLIV